MLMAMHMLAMGLLPQELILLLMLQQSCAMLHYFVNSQVLITAFPSHSLCRSDDLSGERWHCTAEGCEGGCLGNGMLHPLGTMMSVGSSQW
jgi:hypothetical protein